MSESIQIIRQQLKEKQIHRILSMQPGRELDALVGQYVMGLQIEEWRIDPDDPLDYWYRTKPGIHEDDEIERVPNYSTVLFSAEKVLARFQYWTIESHGDNEIGAKLSFRGEEKAEVRSCSTISEAICKAALIAIVNQNRIINQLVEE